MDSYKYKNLTSTALIKTGAGILHGMYVNSTSSGTIAFYDTTSTATAVSTYRITNTITPGAGYHNLGDAAFSSALVALTTATIDATIYYK